MRLLKEDQTVIVSNLIKAESFVSRGVGLLKHRSLPKDEGMWIVATNSIHTFFMKFPIACVFVDRNLVIQKVINEVKPWRLVLPVWKARSVFELNVQTVLDAQLKKGDRLYVVD